MVRMVRSFIILNKINNNKYIFLFKNKFEFDFHRTFQNHQINN